MESPGTNFQLSKWFLDFTTDDRIAMIFYAAEMRWHGFSARYTSWLDHSPDKGTRCKSRFTSVQFPVINGNLITWSDPKFDVSGTWFAREKPISARLFNSDSGFLDWICYQPKSDVSLTVGNELLKGSGYTEQLIMTTLPWRIPMDELRWGRYVSDQNSLVWIELRQRQRQQWLWLNGEKIEKSIIEDDRIEIPEQEFLLNLDRSTILESEKKISAVTGKLVRYFPGFNRIMPVKFLMADETKWLSHGTLQVKEQNQDTGKVIHELVNFNPPAQ